MVGFHPLKHFHCVILQLILEVGNQSCPIKGFSICQRRGDVALNLREGLLVRPLWNRRFRNNMNSRFIKSSVTFPDTRFSLVPILLNLPCRNVSTMLLQVSIILAIGLAKHVTHRLQAKGHGCQEGIVSREALRGGSRHRQAILDTHRAAIQCAAGEHNAARVGTEWLSGVSSESYSCG